MFKDYHRLVNAGRGPALCYNDQMTDDRGKEPWAHFERLPCHTVQRGCALDTGQRTVIICYKSMATISNSPGVTYQSSSP